jgi:predicted nuclease with TOPRIM domain
MGIPPVGKQASSKDENEDLQGELKFLQQKVRMLEEAHLADVKKHQVKETQNKMTIERLREDNNRLRHDLMGRTSSFGKSVKEAVTEAQKIVELQRLVEKLRQKLDDEKAMHQAAVDQNQKLNDQCVQLQDVVNNMSTVNPMREDIVAMKKIGALENKLDLITKQLNEKSALVIQLRKNEGEFAAERQGYESTLAKMQREVQRRDRMLAEAELKVREGAVASRNAGLGREAHGQQEDHRLIVDGEEQTNPTTSEWAYGFPKPSQ